MTLRAEVSLYGMSNHTQEPTTISPPMGDVGPGGGAIGVETPDVDAEYARVQGIGGVTTGAMMGGVGPVPKMFSIADPDGNQIWVVEAG